MVFLMDADRLGNPEDLAVHVVEIDIEILDRAQAVAT